MCPRPKQTNVTLTFSLTFSSKHWKRSASTPLPLPPPPPPLSHKSNSSKNPAALLHRFSVTSKNWTLFLRPSREQSNFSSSHNFQVQLTSLLYAQCATEGGASSLPAPTFRFARRVSSPRLRTDKHPKVLKQRTG